MMYTSTMEILPTVGIWFHFWFIRACVMRDAILTSKLETSLQWLCYLLPVIMWDQWPCTFCWNSDNPVWWIISPLVLPPVPYHFLFFRFLCIPKQSIIIPVLAPPIPSVLFVFLCGQRNTYKNFYCGYRIFSAKWTNSQTAWCKIGTVWNWPCLALQNLPTCLKPVTV